MKDDKEDWDKEERIRRINKKGDREEEEEIGKKDVYRE